MVSKARGEPQPLSSPSNAPVPSNQSVARPDPSVLQQDLQRQFNHHSSARGELTMPCVPSMLDYALNRLVRLFEAIGRQLAPEELQKLRDLIASNIQEGFLASPHARLVIQYQPDPTSLNSLTCNVSTRILSVAQEYQQWIQNREPPLFGSHPDAKVMATAAQFRDPARNPILDVGAGTGRNSLPLARKGHPVDALELTPGLAEQLLNAAVAENLPIRVIQGDILDPLVRMRPAYYKFAIVAEVVSHFRDNDQVRLLLAKMCDVIQGSGLLLFNLFLAVDGYEPNDRVREMSQVAASYIMTRSELKRAMEDLPLEMLSDESVLDYERAHLPQEAWPPTNWFVSWTSGRDVFPIQETPPMELRWILCRRY
ncbi:class I SAM-dependent methyltransferase [Coleofasciculus sp. FACHB-64]|uniref:class I SAM-dependent methyltransferase n=1 Tax=Cyanophyceae TaxID=3028117 RepID=UPI0016882774|nr:class I SAM-dependent methyltransferase [Coleofasciculus sp. FACHB-64]MBD2046641.1 class I SAM-dependent methyltransferase [Coleofasciculus sp. FACHB-64]